MEVFPQEEPQHSHEKHPTPLPPSTLSHFLQEEPCATATKSQLKRQGGNQCPARPAQLQQQNWGLPSQGCSSSHHALLAQVGYSHSPQFAQPSPSRVWSQPSTSPADRAAHRGQAAELESKSCASAVPRAPCHQ